MLNKKEITNLHAMVRKHLLPFSDPGLLETEVSGRTLDQQQVEAIDRLGEFELNYLLLVTAINEINKKVTYINRRFM